MLGHQRVFVDDDGVVAFCLGDAMADPGRVDRAQIFHARNLGHKTRAHCLMPLRDALATILDRLRIGQRRQGCRKIAQEGGGAAAERKVAREAADRNAAEQRIEPDVNDPAFRFEAHSLGNPRHVAFEHNDHVGLAEVRSGFVAKMHRMTRWQGQMACAVLHDRKSKSHRKLRQQADRRRVSSGVAGDDQRILGCGEEARGLGNARLVRTRWQRGHWPALAGGGFRRCGQHLARQ